MEKNWLKQIADANKATVSLTVWKSLTSFLLQIELIRSGSKRPVKMTSNAIENTLSQRIKVVEQKRARNEILWRPEFDHLAKNMLGLKRNTFHTSILL